MKFKYAVFALVLAVLMTGCKKDETENTAETSVTTTASVTEKTEEKTEEKPEDDPEEKKEPETLLDLRVKQLDEIELICKKQINKTDNDSNIYYLTGALSDFKILSENAVELTDVNSTVRDGTGFLFFDQKGADIPVNDIMEPIEWELYYREDYAEIYKGFSFNDPVAVVETDGKVGNPIETDEIIYSCDFSEKEITGFIRQAEPGLYEIYPDPAYCHGMPMLHKTGGDCYRRINDLSVYMDSPVIYSSIVSDKLENVGEKFVYAKMKLSSKYIYSTNDSYISDSQFAEITGVDYTGRNFDHLDSFEIITADTDAVLTSDFTPKETEGDAYETYKVLAENRDTLVNENTVGVILADLDNDGTPEVVSTQLTAEDTQTGRYFGSQADIYRIKDGGLAYIDTIKTGGSSREMFISSGLDHNNKPA